MFDSVARFLAAGLRAGDGVLVIAIGRDRAGFLELLESDVVADAVASGQLVILDARETLARFMLGEMPDPERFRGFLREEVTPLQNGATTRVRAYGDMVDVLWKEGKSRAAIALEELWKEASRRDSSQLLCAYAMGNFYNEVDAERFLDGCQTHDDGPHPEAPGEPHAQLSELGLLQQRARSLESEVRDRKELESALRDALRERSRIEQELRDCVKREQEARQLAEASDQFKDVFLGILGHDLRNPLNTILTTTRLMRMAPEPGVNQKRLDRILSSGMRMERMINQLLDVTRLRLGAGILVDRSAEHDLVPIVEKIIDELRVSHSGQTIELHTLTECLAWVDVDRFEQVVSNMVGNALDHGDPARPITVRVAPQGPFATFSVHNFGPPIDPSFVPMLFDPFKRGHHRGFADGLGLGLYISERIVSAHGGTISVESTAEAGTRFDARFPRGR